MEIVKASGKRERFSEKKLRYSLERVGVGASEANSIVGEVRRRIRVGARTKEILEIVLGLLRHKNPAMAAKYNLKSAMMNLGPSGYPFEEYFAGVLREHGYETRVGEMVKGFCADQEIDIIAVKGDRHLMIECKYHNSSGARSDLKVALYTYARFLDVKEVWEERHEDVEKFHQAVLVTNTKCTSEAIKFAKCRGIKVVAWHYPAGQNLQNLIERKNLYPITVLLSLSNTAKRKLLKRGMVFSRDLIGADIEKISRETGIPMNEMEGLRNEAEKIHG